MDRNDCNLYVVIYLFTASQEQSIAKFHDVGFVNAGHLLAVIFGGIVEGKFSNTQ